MADDLIEEDGTETEAAQDIQQETGQGEASSGKMAKVKGAISNAIGKLLSNRRRLVIIIAGGLVLILLAGGLLFFFSGSKDEVSPSPENAAMTDKEIQAALDKKPDIVFEDIVVLEPFERIALKGSSAMKLISIGISLELTDHRYRKTVVTVEDRLRKIVQGQVREMTWLELRNPEGKIRLKYELLQRMNSIFPKVTIRNIYFTNFLMQ